MRKIAAHYVFMGHNKFIKNGVLNLDDRGTVLGVTSLGDPATEHSGTEFHNGILVPGLINAHCHLELSHLAGALPAGGGMTAFCKGVIGLRGTFTDDAQQAAMRQADARMREEGVVAVGDISNTAASLEVKRHSPIHYHTFVECLGIAPEQADTLLEQARAVAARAAGMGLPATLTPHAPYSMSEQLFKASVESGMAEGLVCIHNQESVDEMQLFATKRGPMRELFGQAVDTFTAHYTNPLQRVLRYIDPDTRLLLVHNTQSTLDDYRQATAANRRTHWVLCPRSNMYIENRLPDVPMLRAAGATIAVGTDSLCSNTHLSVLAELKQLAESFPAIGLGDLLQWATLNGARALGCDHRLGSFDTGKTPGVCLLEGADLSGLRLRPDSRIVRLA